MTCKIVHLLIGGQESLLLFLKILNFVLSEPLCTCLCLKCLNFFYFDCFARPLSNHFSVEVIHGGHFLCAGKHRDYHKGHSIWYDYCDIDNWTPNVVASLVEEIGYEFEGRIRAYWCVPGLIVYRNGLREIKIWDNTMTENMKDCVLNGNHF